MRKCFFERDGILETIDNEADKAGIRDIAGQISTIKTALLPTLTEQQKALFKQFDDAVVSEGTVRVNSAIKALCGCLECRA